MFWFRFRSIPSALPCAFGISCLVFTGISYRCHGVQGIFWVRLHFPCFGCGLLGVCIPFSMVTYSFGPLYISIKCFWACLTFRIYICAYPQGGGLFPFLDVGILLIGGRLVPVFLFYSRLWPVGGVWSLAPSEGRS